MLNIEEAKIDAWTAISDLVGNEYFKSHFATSWQSHIINNNDDDMFEYFMGFEGDEESGKWTVFARVQVSMGTGGVTFLDYKTPEGIRMEYPIKPSSFV